MVVLLACDESNVSLKFIFLLSQHGCTLSGCRRLVLRGVKLGGVVVTSCTHPRGFASTSCLDNDDLFYLNMVEKGLSTMCVPKRVPWDRNDKRGCELCCILKSYMLHPYPR